MQNNSHSISINLSSIIPYQIHLDQDILTLTKGVMIGTISIESLKLELKKHLEIDISRIKFDMVEDDIILKINSNKILLREMIEHLVIDTISRELPYNLTNTDTKKPLIYITEDLMGIPLIGSFYFGVIDRGTNLLQLRTITGCPLNCPFCSVDEGPASKSKLRDFIVDPDYLLSTYKEVLKEKELSDAEAHLDGQGEPMSYPYLVNLVQQLEDIPQTKITSIQTNGWYLTNKLIDDLEAAGLTRINLSINTLDLVQAKKLSGRGDYPLQHILEMTEYIANSKIELLLAPLWIPSINDVAIEELVKFTKKIITKKQKYPILGIQNYLLHSEGRNIKGIKQMKFPEFKAQLKEIGIKNDIPNLVLKPYMFESYKTKMINNPMKINEKVSTKIILPGRVQNEALGAAKNRVIHIMNATESFVGKTVTVQITRNRHNIFFGKIS